MKASLIDKKNIQHVEMEKGNYIRIHLNPVQNANSDPDELHRPHAQPQPQGAANVRHEGDQRERGDEGLGDGHLLTQAQHNHRELLPLPSTKELSIHLIN